MSSLVPSVLQNSDRIMKLTLQIKEEIEKNKRLVNKFNEATELLRTTRKNKSDIFCCSLCKNITNATVNIFIWNPDKKLSYTVYYK